MSIRPLPGHIGLLATIEAGERGTWRGRIRAITPVGVIVDTTAQAATLRTGEVISWTAHPSDPRHLAGGRIRTAGLLEVETPAGPGYASHKAGPTAWVVIYPDRYARVATADLSPTPEEEPPPGLPL